MTLPPNSEVWPLSVAVLVSTEPMLTPAGIVIRNAKRFVVSVPCRSPLIAAGPYVPVVAFRSRAAAFGERRQIGEALAEAARVRGRLRHVELDRAAGPREAGDRQLAVGDDRAR